MRMRFVNMKKDKKKILNEIAKITNKNKILHDRKNKLKIKIEAIDLEIYNLYGNYNQLLGKLYEN